jgi:hypothetical protein
MSIDLTVLIWDVYPEEISEFQDKIPDFAVNMPKME